MKNLVILISGRGSNMQALLEANLPCRVAAVISNKADAAGLEIAKQHGIATQVISHRDYPGRESFDAALAALIDTFQPDIIALAVPCACASMMIWCLTSTAATPV